MLEKSQLQSQAPARIAEALKNFEFDAVLFDLDGTLIDSMPAIRQSLEVVCDRYFPEKPELIETAMTLVGLPLHGIMEIISDGLGNQDEMVALYREHNRALLKTIPFFPGVIHVLEGLRSKRIRTGIVTTKARDAAWTTIESLGAAHFFEVVITGDDVTKHKPHPLPLLTACSRLGVHPSKVMYIGDTPADVLSATAAGCISGGAMWGAVDLDALTASTPTICLESISELLHLSAQ